MVNLNDKGVSRVPFYSLPDVDVKPMRSVMRARLRSWEARVVELRVELMNAEATVSELKDIVQKEANNEG